VASKTLKFFACTLSTCTLQLPCEIINLFHHPLMGFFTMNSIVYEGIRRPFELLRVMMGQLGGRHDWTVL